jgi:hypothetical protein
MTNREELARVLYEAPFGTLALSNWPPSHPDDREWWLTRADAVLAHLATLKCGNGCKPFREPRGYEYEW